VCVTRSSSLPRDVDQRAIAIVNLSTQDGEIPEPSPISAYLSEIGRKEGLKGGKARAKKLSSTKRKTIAQKSAQARWKKLK